VQKRYPILRAFSVIFKVLGGIVAALTILGAIGICGAMIAGGAALGNIERELGTPLPGIGGIASGIIIGLLILLIRWIHRSYPLCFRRNGISLYLNGGKHPLVGPTVNMTR
jgi:uncharacterized membrane protein